MSGIRLTPRPFRYVVSLLLPLFAAALCAAQTFPSASTTSRDLLRTTRAAPGAATASQSAAAAKAADAAAIVGDDWSSLFSKPSSPGSKAASAIAAAVAQPALRGVYSHRPLPEGAIRSEPPAHAYFPQAPPASLTLA
jgi:hypothetical protein